MVPDRIQCFQCFSKVFSMFFKGLCSPTKTLEEQHKDGTGEDWNKIAHIPNLNFWSCWCCFYVQQESRSKDISVSASGLSHFRINL